MWLWALSILVAVIAVSWLRAIGIGFSKGVSRLVARNNKTRISAIEIKLYDGFCTFILAGAIIVLVVK